MDTAKEKRTALVSGGSRGLGRAMAFELAAAGAHVAVNYFNRRDAAEQTCATIRQSGGHARAFRADVRDESEVARLVQEVNGAFGAVDILVVNATGSQPFFSIEEQTWQRCLISWSSL
jgi:3-oxoacyl-[acyl-carrier protein] reductase